MSFVNVDDKISVGRVVVLTTLPQGGQTCLTYHRDVRVLERFLPQCIRSILNIQQRVISSETSKFSNRKSQQHRGHAIENAPKLGTVVETESVDEK